ncbi:hypothetical protein GGX14DRAFT_401704 [Mycena pura]|uniref:Uncharacterized protein n=1 Tax=Mycena pura TaxID=153505 RepID=A0AAD6V216_9AGAR|nr:hypothetical protein GGX14DRAFT_401704 [Mycena pura]
MSIDLHSNSSVHANRRLCTFMGHDFATRQTKCTVAGGPNRRVVAWGRSAARNDVEWSAGRRARSDARRRVATRDRGPRPKGEPQGEPLPDMDAITDPITSHAAITARASGVTPSCKL